MIVSMIEQPAGLKSFGNTYEIDFLIGFIFQRFYDEEEFTCCKTKRALLT